jgi:P-type E1-E2 ATPase
MHTCIHTKIHTCINTFIPTYIKPYNHTGIIRDGVVSSIDIKKVVVGDILLLNAGDRVPADGVLVEGSDVSCNESALTGNIVMI